MTSTTLSRSRLRGASRTSAAAVRSLVNHTMDALAERDWAAATGYAERAVDADPRNADAHLLSFMAHRHISSLDQLSGVAAQIVAETPASLTPLAQLLDTEAAAGEPSHDTTRALLAAHPQVAAPARERLSNLQVAQRAFEGVFDDADWTFALARISLEEKRAMERARADAEAVFAEAQAEARVQVAASCGVAEVRVPRVAKAVSDAQRACEHALDDLERSTGAADTAVTESFSYLPTDIRTARAGLWVGSALVMVAVVLLVLALVPSGSSITNPLASFAPVSVVLALCVLAAGVVLLAVRGNLVRSNRRGLAERVEAKASAHERASSHADEVNEEVAAIRARCRALESMRLGDDSFEDALGELEAAVAVLGGAKATGAEAASVSSVDA